MALDISTIPKTHESDRIGSIRGIIANYPDTTNVITEFIQNAEDANASEVKFTVYEECIRIENNGNAFRSPDIERICKFSKGKWEERDEKIGKFGVGFLSSYHFTDAPNITSNGISLTIQPDGEIHPQEHPESADKQGAVFNFPLRKLASRFSDEIGVGVVDNERLDRFIHAFQDFFYRNILFLSEVDTIEGWDARGGNPQLVCRCRKPRENEKKFRDTGLIVSQRSPVIALEWLDQTSGEFRRRERKWLIFNQDFRQDYIEQHNQTPPGKTTVSVAFSLEAEHNDELGRLYAYFPTRIHTGFSFNVNAHFAPNTGRTDIRDEPDSIEGKWNHWLIDCLGKLCVGSLDLLKLKVSRPLDWYQVIPIECSEERDYLKRIVDVFVEDAKSKAVIWSGKKNRWQSKLDSIYMVDALLRTILVGSDINLVPVNIQSDGRARKLFELIELSWFDGKGLIEHLKCLPKPCPIIKAPKLVNSEKKISRILSYFKLHPYDGMLHDLKDVSLGLDQYGILHTLNTEGDRVWVADKNMRDILQRSNVPLITKPLQARHKHFLFKAMSPFSVDELIDFLEQRAEESRGKPISKAYVTINSIAKVRKILGYLKSHDVFETSEYGEDALEGTPLCIAQDGKVYCFPSKDPEDDSEENDLVLIPLKGIRQVMAGSGVKFIHQDLAKYRKLLQQAGIDSFGTNELFKYLLRETRDGMEMSEGPVPTRNKTQLKGLYTLIRKSILRGEQLDTLKRLPIFLTSSERLRPLTGGSQGPLSIRSGYVMDPLGLDNLLHDIFKKDKYLSKWLKTKLGVSELNLDKYILKHLMPQYEAVGDNVKLDLLRILMKHRKQIAKKKSLLGPLKSAKLIKGSDDFYHPGQRVCFKNVIATTIFGNEYVFPDHSYGHLKMSKDQSVTEGWTELFSLLGVRRLVHADDIVKMAELLAATECTETSRKRANRLLMYLGRNWDEYTKDSEPLEKLRYMNWVPMTGLEEGLENPFSSYIHELKVLVGGQGNCVQTKKLDMRLAEFLEINTKVETQTIVNNLLQLMQNDKPTPFQIYEELDRRRKDTDSILKLRDEIAFDIGQNGNYWAARDLFFNCPPEIQKYKRQLPDRLRRLTWLCETMGVNPSPTESDYVSLLKMIADAHIGQIVSPKEREILSKTYNYLAKHLDSTSDEELSTLSSQAVVLGEDGLLHLPDTIYINDLPNFTDYSFNRSPVFMDSDLAGTELFIKLGVISILKAMRPTLMSVVDEIINQSYTDFMRDVCREAILRVNYNTLGPGYDINHDREFLLTLEVHDAQGINVQWSVGRGSDVVVSDVIDRGAFYGKPILYVKVGDLKSRALWLAKELARVLAPDEQRTLVFPYETLFNLETVKEIDDYLDMHGFGPLPQSVGPGWTEEYPQLPTDPSLPDGDSNQIQKGLSPKQPEDSPPSWPPRPPRKIHYVDVKNLKVDKKEDSTPQEAHPFSIHATARRGGGGGGGGMAESFSDENMETEAKAFQLIKTFEKDNGWMTDDNGGRGFEGYDIKAQKGKTIKYIEVKSSRSNNYPDMSFRQLEEAKRRRRTFYLYRVINLEISDTPPTLFIIRDPYGYIDLEASAYTAKGYKDNPVGEIAKVTLK